jgi:hypothetical protein
MRFVMNPDMVYQYPIWAVGLLLDIYCSGHGC